MVSKFEAEKPSGGNRNLSDLLNDVASDQNLLDPKDKKRLPVDLHPKIHRELGSLQLLITAEEGKKVTNRMLITEALVDLFKKYERASKGAKEDIKYMFADSKEEYNSNL